LFFPRRYVRKAVAFMLELYGEQWYGITKSDNKENITGRYVRSHWKKKGIENTLEEMFIINLRGGDVTWKKGILGRAVAQLLPFKA
jgi:hypothetical protein